MMKKKRVFLFMPYIPYPVDRGTYQRVYHLFVELARAFEVDLACLQDEEKRPMDAFVPLTNRCIAIPFDHPPWKKLFPDRLRDPLPTTVHHWQAEGVKEQLATFVEGETYDRVIFIDLVLWPYIRELFPNHPKKIMDRSRVDWLFQTEELKTLKVGLLNRFLRWENLRKIAKLERAVYRELAGMIVCGIDDRTFLEERLGDARKVFVLANGFNEDYFDLENRAFYSAAHSITPRMSMQWIGLRMRSGRASTRPCLKRSGPSLANRQMPAPNAGRQSPALISSAKFPTCGPSINPAGCKSCLSGLGVVPG